MTQSIKDIGLANHLGAEKYAEFVKRMDLHEPMAIIARALHVDRKTVLKYRDVYNQELANKT